MIRTHSTVLKVVLAISAIALTCASSAQSRTRKRAPALAPTPSPTQKNCGISLHIPPGWELTPAPTDPAVVESSGTPTSSSAASDVASDTAPATPAQSASADSAPAPACSFILAPKFPSENVRNTDTEGPIDRMEIQVVDGNIDTAAPQ